MKPSVPDEQVDWRTKYSNFLQKRPLVIARFDEKLRQQLLESRHGLRRFTIAKTHPEISDAKAPTLCLVETTEGDQTACYLGVLTKRAKITTIDTRLTFQGLRRIKFDSLTRLATELGRFEADFYERLMQPEWITALGPKQSVQVLDALWISNESEVRAALSDIPNFVRLEGAAWEQKDAIEMAKTVFGLTGAARLEDFEDETGAHLYEDDVIQADATNIAGYELLGPSLTGRRVFTRKDERLVVYLANRKPLEELFGVDLVYYNEAQGNVVMVQYKMLEASDERGSRGGDWIFRPDEQLRDEMARMRLPLESKTGSDYRLHRGPFYFKFVKRKLTAEPERSFVISLEHLEQLLARRDMSGPRGGLRISYAGLAGNYLREGDLVGLIRSGYVGTHRADSAWLRELLEAVNRGNRGLVLGWQSKIRSVPNGG